MHDPAHPMANEFSSLVGPTNLLGFSITPVGDGEIDSVRGASFGTKSIRIPRVRVPACPEHSNGGSFGGLNRLCPCEIPADALTVVSGSHVRLFRMWDGV